MLEENVHNNQMGDAAALTVTLEDRREAAKLNTVGKHEPKLSENGIPTDVLENCCLVTTSLNWKNPS